MVLLFLLLSMVCFASSKPSNCQGAVWRGRDTPAGAGLWFKAQDMGSVHPMSG